ncbi:MAG: hypothetical protein A2231_12785 [Candidatus Firestonebacteria bacterium RIFOXYA2_FULL_40_8]|nr:MAG: hypothetical protein A2231_12785 [Candidatus Firestonebacteria bacterium RIFOXYA2_FULL_40_8]
MDIEAEERVIVDKNTAQIIKLSGEVLVALLFIYTFFIHWKRNRNRLDQLFSRSCLGKEWKEKYPEIPKEEIRRFLGVFVESFSFPKGKKLNFGPNDILIDVYRIIYPAGGGVDNLELETFADNLLMVYSLDLSKLNNPENKSLGQLFLLALESRRKTQTVIGEFGTIISPEDMEKIRRLFYLSKSLGKVAFAPIMIISGFFVVTYLIVGLIMLFQGVIFEMLRNFSGTASTEARLWFIIPVLVFPTSFIMYVSSKKPSRIIFAVIGALLGTLAFLFTAMLIWALFAGQLEFSAHSLHVPLLLGALWLGFYKAAAAWLYLGKFNKTALNDLVNEGKKQTEDKNR